MSDEVKSEKPKCYFCGNEKSLQFCMSCITFYCKNGETPTCWGKHMRVALVHVETYMAEQGIKK